LNKNNYLSLFCVLLLTLPACGEKPAAPAAVPLVVTQKAASGDAGLQASFAGEVRARSEAALGFRVGGKITERLVDVGAVVKAGTPLARLDARDLHLNSASARSQLAAAQADMVQAQADYTRYSDLYQKKFVSGAEIDKRKAALDVAQWTGEELGWLAISVARQIEMENEEVEIVQSGTIFEAGELVMQPMHDIVLKHLPKAKLLRLDGPPVVGPLMLGMQMAGIDPYPMCKKLIESAKELVK